MRITAVAIGTRGDVQPLAELGVELRRRGHDFRLASLEKFRPMIEGKGVPYLHLDGDADLLMKLLVTDYRTSSDFVDGCEALYRSAPGLMDQIAQAVRGSDVVLYGLLAGFARHACDLYHIPCVRLFFSPFDKTDQYSLYTARHNSPLVGLTYWGIGLGMNWLTCRLANGWRRAHGLPPWRMTGSYRMQGGRPVLTFYPVTPLLMPPDPKWGPQIHVTGYWYHPQEDADCRPDEALARFLAEGERPVFVGFGKAESPELKELQVRALEALRRTGLRAVVQADQLDEAQRDTNGGRLCFIGNVPYAWLFRQVRAVVHHGGCTTNGIGLWAGCPTLVIALALDQYYYGRAVYEKGLGPKPLYIRKRLCGVEEIEAALRDLASGRYDAAAAQASREIRREDGCRAAADILERRFGGAAAAAGNP